MKAHYCVTKKGEQLVVWQCDDGRYCCPVCGRPELEDAPYYADGGASFQLCSCGFEYGYDDSPLATKSALAGIEANWDRWRLKLIEQAKNSRDDLAELMRNLKNIGIELAYDLVPVKRDALPSEPHSGPDEQ